MQIAINTTQLYTSLVGSHLFIASSCVQRLILYEEIGPVSFLFNKAHPLFQILIHDLPNDRPKHQHKALPLKDSVGAFRPSKLSF
jgi:hypothetical protein